MHVQRFAAFVVVMLWLLAGCSALGSQPDPKPATGVLEHGSLNVSALTVADAAPLWHAKDARLFGALDVQITIANSGADSTAGLVSGTQDVAFGSYPTFFAAKAAKAADIKIISDGSAARPGRQAIVVAANSAIHGIKDLAGKRIGISAKNTMSHLLTASALADTGVDPGGIQWVESRFDVMAAELLKGHLDAAYLTEPFLTIAEQQGITRIGDPATGPTAGIPINGYAALAGFIKSNPNVIRAFQAGIRKATNEITLSRPLLNTVTAKAAKSTPDLMNLGTPPAFSAGIPTPGQIQRVPDLMLKFGVLKERIETTDMLGPDLAPAEGGW